MEASAELNAVTAEALENCSRELIHIPGAIQPHGALFVLDEPGLIILQTSANAGTFCGLDPAPGQPLAEAAPEAAGAIASILAAGDPALLSPVRVQLAGNFFDAMLHRHDGVLFLELEPAQEVQSFHRRLQRAFADLRAVTDITAMYEEAARFVADITGFERVMVYKFDKDWHGEVVGECLTAKVDSYMGHHFPASDIPAQARALYSRSWLRIIPDASYTPVPIEPTLNPKTDKPLDLSHAGLRSVSPIHLEYLRNMNVAASMSISLLVEGRLWGLIACHHRTPRALSFAVRAACEMFGQVASLEIAAQQEARRLAEHVQATAIQTEFFEIIAGEKNAMEALVKYTPSLLEFMSAAGAVIHVNDRTMLVGETPDEKQAAELIAWLEKQKLQPLLATDSLQGVFPPAAAYQDKASGMLAVRLSRVEPHFVLWLRPEVVTTVTWAGNPEKPVDEASRLHPRKSFSTWEERVRGKSTPWNEAERQGARELVTALNALVLRRTENLISLNSELERKNTDLNSFAYIASHDLKEPLRGISNYCTFLHEDHAGELSPEAKRKLDTLTTLAAQSEDLLRALSHFSRIGRIEIERKEIDMEELLTGVLTSLDSVLWQEKVKLVRVNPLPVTSCDPVLVREVFSNLIRNAIRYNNRPEKLVEIAWRRESAERPRAIFSVRDNGIGIREKHFGDIFQIFRRLHAHEDFGGGTGAGLAIVKSIVEKHDGTIWLESREGEGTTFYFTLSA